MHRLAIQTRVISIRKHTRTYPDTTRSSGHHNAGSDTDQGNFLSPANRKLQDLRGELGRQKATLIRKVTNSKSLQDYDIIFLLSF